MAVTVTVALGAAVAAVAAARYRLSVEFVPAVIIFAVFAGTVPAWVDDVLARVWPTAVCLSSAVVMLMAAGWAVRSRGAQLPPGWGAGQRAEPRGASPARRASLRLERGAEAAGAGGTVFGGVLLRDPELGHELLQPGVGGRAEAELVSP